MNRLLLRLTLATTVLLASGVSARAEPIVFDRAQGEVVIGGEVEPLSSGERRATGDLADALALFSAKVDDRGIQSALTASNQKNSALKRDEIIARDIQWKEAGGDNATVAGVLSAECSGILRRFCDTFRQFENVIATDATGVVVCATEKPEAYFFGEQEWWREGMKARGGQVAAATAVAEHPAPGVPTQALYAPVVDPDSGATLGVARAIYKSGL